MIVFLLLCIGNLNALPGNRTFIHTGLPTNITVRKIYANDSILYSRQHGNLTKRTLTSHFNSSHSRETRFGSTSAPTTPSQESTKASHASPPDQQKCTPQFPLPQCYTGPTGFMCCNHQLEQVMLRSFDELKNSRINWSSANINQISKQVQRNAEHEFGMRFEVITGVGDFASKSTFYGDKICKIYWECRYILAYATPMPETPLHSGDQPTNTGSSKSDRCTGFLTPSPLPYKKSLPPLKTPSLPLHPMIEDNTNPNDDVLQRPTPRVRIDTTAYGTQQLEQNQNGEDQPTIKTEQDSDLPFSSFDLSSNLKEQAGVSLTEEQTNEIAVPGSYGTQTISPPDEAYEIESIRRSKKTAAYGPVAPTRDNINYSWRF